MNVDDIVKLMLALAISVSLVGISYQIMRLIGKLADSIQDLRRAVQNVSSASDMILEDYGEIRKLLRVFMDVVGNFEENILSPIRLVTKLIQRFTPGNNKESDVDSDL